MLMASQWQSRILPSLNSHLKFACGTQSRQMPEHHLGHRPGGSAAYLFAVLSSARQATLPGRARPAGPHLAGNRAGRSATCEVD